MRFWIDISLVFFTQFVQNNVLFYGFCQWYWKFEVIPTSFLHKIHPLCLIIGITVSKLQHSDGHTAAILNIQYGRHSYVRGNGNIGFWILQDISFQKMYSFAFPHEIPTWLYIKTLWTWLKQDNCLLKCYVNTGFKNQFLESLSHWVVLAKYCRGLVESGVDMLWILISRFMLTVN